MPVLNELVELRIRDLSKTKLLLGAALIDLRI